MTTSTISSVSSTSKRRGLGGGVGSLLRRIGGSQRSGFVSANADNADDIMKQRDCRHHRQHQSQKESGSVEKNANGCKYRQQQQQLYKQQQEEKTTLQKQTSSKGLGGLFMRKAKSLRDLGSTVTTSTSGNSGSSGSDKPGQPLPVNKKSNTQTISEASTGGFRTMLKRATSLRGSLTRTSSLSSRSSTFSLKSSTQPLAQQGELEPVYVMTDATQGKIVFQSLQNDNVDNDDQHSADSTTHSNSHDDDGNNDEDEDRQNDDRENNSVGSPDTARTTEIVMDFSENCILELAETSTDGNDLQLSVNSSSGGKGLGLPIRFRNLFTKTKSGRTVSTLESSEDMVAAEQGQRDVHVPKRHRDPAKVKRSSGGGGSSSSKTRSRSHSHEIALPSLMDQDLERQRTVVDPTTRIVEGATENLNFMDGLLQVVAQYEEHCDNDSECSSSSNGEDEEEEEDGERVGKTNESDKTAACSSNESHINTRKEKASLDEESSVDGDDEDDDIDDDDDDDDENYYESHFHATIPCQFDIVVEPTDHPEREYDELEKFYQEETFRAVGGSYLLGKASELMSVPELEDEDELQASNASLVGTRSERKSKNTAMETELESETDEDDDIVSVDSGRW